MSEAGSIFDKLIALVEAIDANYVTERGIRLISSLNDEDFPHCFAFEPVVTNSELDFQQEDEGGDYTLLIVTKGETQEAILLRVDAIKAAVKADRTLTGDVDFALATAYKIEEDPRTKIKAAPIVVSTRRLE